jgi:hypothetical protein
VLMSCAYLVQCARGPSWPASPNPSNSVLPLSVGGETRSDPILGASRIPSTYAQAKQRNLLAFERLRSVHHCPDCSVAHGPYLTIAEQLSSKSPHLEEMFKRKRKVLAIARKIVHPGSPRIPADYLDDLDACTNKLVSHD